MLSEAIFSKPLYDITLEDLQNFFSEEQDESAKLEFKSGQVSIDGLYKEICAFLNTEGGVIIVGAPREQKRTLAKDVQQTYSQGALTPSTTFRNKDWLNHKIVSNISPSPSGIKIQDILTPEGNYFIIDVPQSMTPPHQCSGVYYIRMERDSMPAPHGIVEALFSRRQKPKIQVSFDIFKVNAEKVILQTNLNNISPYPTEKISISTKITRVKDVQKKADDNTLISTWVTNPIAEEFHVFSSVDIILWEDLIINIDCYVFHNKLPFLIHSGFWSRDVGITYYTGVFHPFRFGLIEGEYSDCENPKGLEYYENLLVEHLSK